MRTILLTILLSLSFLAKSQITFEEIVAPVDFNMEAIRKSPTGEYFTQATNDSENIYSSLDGKVWTKTALPLSYVLGDIRFFSDGTPLLQKDRKRNIIRRDGKWYDMKINGSSGYIETSFIKEDTLFAYHDHEFVFSLDKGQSFTHLFLDNLISNTAHIFKFDHYFVLHHAVGTIDSLSVFDKSGHRVLAKPMEVIPEQIVYNECGQILFLTVGGFYLLKEDGLDFSAVALSSLYPEDFALENVWSAGSNYYVESGSHFYKSNGCNFIWEDVGSYIPERYNELSWVGPDETILISKPAGNAFQELTSGSNEWKNYVPDINFPLLQDVHESSNNQIIRTSNSFFSKYTSEDLWTKLDTSSRSNFEVQYSPSGDLYINPQSEIYFLYSSDNGQHFSPIQLPQGQMFFADYEMHVLGDGVIFITDTFFGVSYYTLNNGKDWISVTISEPYFYAPPLVKLVENYYIVLADFYWSGTITRINIVTNEVTTFELSAAEDPNIDKYTMSDDGTIYFEKRSSDQAHSLFRYRFGEEIDSIGEFTELFKYHTLYTSGNEVYFLGQLEYYQLNGTELITHPYIGLPGAASFQLAESEYLYTIYKNNRIFRSTNPLSYQKYISGNIYVDSNQDCIADTSEYKLANWQVKVENEEHVRVVNTNRQGYFQFSVPDGEYTLSTRPVNTNWEICTPSYPISIDDQQVNVDRNFIAFGTSACAELEIDFSTPLLRRCFTNYYSIRVRNTGPEASTGTLLTLNLDPFFEFISATIPFEWVNDSTLSFDLGVLDLNEEIIFQVYFRISCEAPLGIEHCLSGQLDDENECGDTRSYYEECQHNIGSFDPNDKRMFNEAGKETQQIDKGEFIYYHIRFQNTGTDTAFNIRILDPLSPVLDLSTLEMLSASHPYTYSITDGPDLLVEFEKILLPDSTNNEAASHGYFKFRIKPLAQYDYGTTIPNQAGIYFDFNEPVLTNETSLVILPSTGINNIEDILAFDVFPNPVNNLLTLKFKESDRNRIDAYEILNLSGQIIRQSKITGTYPINVSSLNSGVYLLELKGNGKVLGAKTFVKQSLK